MPFKNELAKLIIKVKAVEAETNEIRDILRTGSKSHKTYKSVPAHFWLTISTYLR